MRLIFKNGSRKYDISTEKRITLISGNSGIGKSTMIDDLHTALMNSNYITINDIDLIDDSIDYVYSDNNIILPRNIEDAENAYNKNNNCLFVVDETFMGLKKQYTSGIISKSSMRFLIICRSTNIVNITMNLSSLYSIMENEDGTTILSDYDSGTFIKEDSRVNPTFILTEDTTEGKLIFDLYTKDIRVESCAGKNNIVNTISELRDYLERGEFILSVDMCAMGSLYEDVILELESLGFEPRVNKKYLSFEKLILDALYAYKIKYDEYANELEEGFYEGMLNHIMKETYGISYMKGTIPSLMLFTSIYKSFRKYYYFIPDKNIRERNILLEELLRFIEKNKRLSALFKVIKTGIDNIDEFTNEEFIIMDIIVDMFVNKDIKYKTSRISKLGNESSIIELLSNNNFSVKEIKRDNISLHKVIDNLSIGADEFIRKFS